MCRRIDAFARRHSTKDTPARRLRGVTHAHVPCDLQIEPDVVFCSRGLLPAWKR